MKENTGQKTIIKAVVIKIPKNPVFFTGLVQYANTKHSKLFIFVYMKLTTHKFSMYIL